MRKRSFCHIPLILSVGLAVYISAHNAHAQHRSFSVKSNSFDSLAAIRLLPLSREDSLVLHCDRTDTLDQYANINDVRRLSVSGDSLAYLVRTITNHFLVDSEGIQFCALVIRYSNEGSPSTTRSIRQDSINVIVASLSSYEPSLQFVDINYDGYKDIIVSFTVNTGDRVGCNFFYTFDPVSSSFDADTALYAIFHDQDIDVDNASKLISTGGRSGARGYAGSEYRWDGQQYIHTADESVEDNAEGTASIETRIELINGKWTTVKSDTTWYK